MMSNDWLRLVGQMLEVDDDDADAGGLRVMSFRYQASLHSEAVAFIVDARRRFPEIAAFIEGLSGSAQERCQLLIDGLDPTSRHYLGDWLAAHRNVTFHYPEMHPEKAQHGKEEIAEGLRGAAHKISRIRSPAEPFDLRFDFADEVIVEWLPDDNDPAPIVSLRQAVLVLSDFVREAAEAYLNSRPAGTFTKA